METENQTRSSAAPAPDAWAREAARLPIAFSQVREDPRIDEILLAEAGPKAKVLMIASGGDTAASLVATGRVGKMRLVDINEAQLALADLKLQLLQIATPAARLAVLGHAPAAGAERAKMLKWFLEEAGYGADMLGPVDFVDAVGADHAGRYEVLFHHLREALREHDADLATLLDLADPAEQSHRISPGTALGQALDEAFTAVMRLENLVCLFGETATRNAQRSFASHFAARLRHVLGSLPAKGNPFLAQLLLGAFRNGAAYDWFQRDCPKRMPEIFLQCATATEALASADPASLDFVHLSNILDWLSPAEAAETLALTFRALRPGGLTVIRQLNSTLDIRGCEERFSWREKQAATLLQQDRSFFYRGLFIGVKPVRQ